MSENAVPLQLAFERLTSDQGRYTGAPGRLHFTQAKVEGCSSTETTD